LLVVFEEPLSCNIEHNIYYLCIVKRNRNGFTIIINKVTKDGMFKKYFHPFILCLLIFPVLISGCSDRRYVRSTFMEANDLFSQGNYEASLSKYQEIIEKAPKEKERILFEMGILYSHPGNRQKDYQKALECFQKLIRDYPKSGYRQDSEMMVFNINNVIAKDKLIAAKQAQIESLRQEVQSRGDEIRAMQENVRALNKEVKLSEDEIAGKDNEIVKLQKEISLIRLGPADRILIEKKDRRLTLFAKGNVIKTCKIALGGNPDGPKVKQGDNKTPEGIYVIDSRNKDSRYHLSLHISYPNEEDKKRAKKLGVSPGGDIMIHGIMNGYSWVGDSHTESDWTKGCIAVTDEEIEEIDKLTPDGTVVEIRP
jgi:tetratricopeptide (TPR) repeat protein